MRLRAATRSDIPVIVGLVRRCDESVHEWAGREVPIPPEAGEELEWELRFARSGAWIQVAEDEDGTIAGVVAFANGQASREDRTLVPGLAHVNAVFVNPDRWRRGIARRLLDAADAAMRTAGYDRAQLWTLEGSPAERLYTTLGWTRDGRRDVYAPMGLAIVAYVKAL
ncbi:MAG TPA: GNAT family N-acetyltransferase [Baekduia sp.]|nr:GNAT family N-acetyltransferase [Baekduia sp.]